MSTNNNNQKKKEKKTKKEPVVKKPVMCYFCLVNSPTTEIHRAREVLPACKSCYSIMLPHINSKGGLWGWQIAELRPRHRDMAVLAYTPSKKCPHCRLKFQQEESLIHHMSYSHIPNHPNPFSADKLSPNEREKWRKALERVPH